MPEKHKLFRFTIPRRQILMMVIVLALFAVIIALLAPQVMPIFLANTILNGTILFVFAVGVFACFWQVLQVTRTVNWINGNTAGQDRVHSTPRLLAALVVLMKGNKLPSGMSTGSAQSITDSVATRLDESREVTRYLVNLLIFLGLLGTFYGLATTIPGVVETIKSLNVDAGGGDGFGQVMKGLETQLGGMGTAFGSSLIGLTGSLVVGLLELFAGHGQNRFYREFEEWISHFTSVGMAEKGMELQVDPNDDTALAKAFRGLSESLGMLEARLASQEEKGDQTYAMFERFTDAMETQQNMSADLRNAMRSVEQELIRIHEDMAIGRDTTTQEIRRDINSVVTILKSAVDGSES